MSPVLDVEVFRVEPETRSPRDFPAGDRDRGVAREHKSLLTAGQDPDHTTGWPTVSPSFAKSPQRLGCRPNLEFMPWTDVQRPRAGRAQSCERAAHPNGGMLVDAFHFDRGRAARRATSPRLPRRAASATRSSATRRPRVPRDVPRTSCSRRAPSGASPAKASLDLVALLRALPAGIPLALEVPTHTLAKSTPGASSGRAGRSRARAACSRGRSTTRRARGPQRPRRAEPPRPYAASRGGTRRSRFASGGKSRIHSATTTSVPTPPTTIEPTGPSRSAIAPARNSPSWLLAPMNVRSPRSPARASRRASRAAPASGAPRCSPCPPRRSPRARIESMKSCENAKTRIATP